MIRKIESYEPVRGACMIRKIESYIRKYHMIEAGDHVIAGVSGGADSICMLRVLLALREPFGHTVSVVHVEHGIRGEDSLKDAEFVRNFCRDHGIGCLVCHVKVPQYADAHGMSEEEAGRHLRYAAFEEEKKKYPNRSVKIAVAHNMGDHAETMLFHLVRGTGISGLLGIAPVRGDLIRPLLEVGRNEIEKYLTQMGQDYCIDVTNESDLYSRNQIRHNVLPSLRQVNEKADEHMYLAAEQLREIDDYIRRQAAALEDKACVMEEWHRTGKINAKPENMEEKAYVLERQSASGTISKMPENAEGEASNAQIVSVTIKKEIFESAEPVLQKEMLHHLLSRLACSSRDISREHVSLVRQLFAKQNGRQVQLPYGLIAVRTYEGVKICHDQEEQSGKSRESWDRIKDQFSFRLLEKFSIDITKISKKKYTKCFDYDKIKVGFCVRSRQPGDYLVVNASGDRQKLKKYLVNEKIPVKEREQLMLLADGAHIMWVVGHRISSYYKVDEHTKRILEVTFYGGEEDE